MIPLLNIAGVSAEERNEKCPLQKFGYGHTFYETKFYQRHCKYVLCRGNTESPSGNQNKRSCWDVLERECSGKAIPDMPIYNDADNAVCPLLFYTLLNKKFLESDSMMLSGVHHFVKADITDTNFFKQDCERDPRCCIRNMKSSNVCWEKLLIEKKIKTR